MSNLLYCILSLVLFLGILLVALAIVERKYITTFWKSIFFLSGFIMIIASIITILSKIPGLLS